MHYRALPISLEMRADGKGARLEGYAARYDEVAELAPGVQERIAPGAFGASLRGDIMALLDHDPTKLLARTKSGTLRLEERADGLAFSLDVPDTSAGRDALALARRHDLGGASIGFMVEKSRDDGPVHVIERADLIEISIIQARPAYASTSVHARKQPPIVVDSKRRLKRLKRFLRTV
ncbi:MAG: HK97 family phage prohead protease [Pseudomonadota bacterium]